MAAPRKPVSQPSRSTPGAPPTVARVEAPKAAPQAAPTPAIPTPPEAILAVAVDAREQFRKVAETGIEQGRAVYARLKTGAESAAGSLETSFAATREGLRALNGKTFDALNTHTQASFEHARALLAAKDVKDLLALQGDFVRKQFELFSAHAGEFAAEAQKLAADAVKPLKTAVAA